MTPFRRYAGAGTYSIYVPRRAGGVVQRSTGTKDATTAKRMERMVKTLADTARWDVLEAIVDGRLSLNVAYSHYQMQTLDAALAETTDVPVRPLADRWLGSLRLADRTVAGYRGKVERVLPDDLRVSQFTPGWVRDTLAALPVSSGTRGQYLHVLTQLADYLVAHGHLDTNRLRERGLVPRARSNAPRVVWRTIEDDQRLVDAAPEPYRSYFALVHATGAERDAALAMRRRDLDLEAGTVHIPGTKTRTRDRKGVPVEPWALPILRRHCRGLLPDAPLFAVTRAAVNKEHQRAREAAKLTGYQLRDARHSYAVRAILRGAPLWQVSKWLGHSNLGITARVYAQFELEEALAAVGAAGHARSESADRATIRATIGGRTQ